MNKDSSLSFRRLFLISVPAILGVAIEPVASIVDTAFVGRINSQWLAGLGLSTSVFNSFIWIFNFLVFGVTARVSQALGADEAKQISSNIKLALYSSVVLGLIACVSVALLREFILEVLMGASAELIETTTPYYLVRCLGLPFILFLSALTGILRGLQKIKESFYLLLLVTVINIALTYALLYQFKIDFVGASIGTVFSYFVGAAVGLTYLLKNRRDLNIDLSSKVELSSLLSFGKESFAIFGRTGALVLAFFLATSAVSRIGETQLGAHQVAIQCWLFASFLIDGFAVTGTSLGGKFLGGGQYTLFQTLTRRLLIYGFALGCIFSLLFATLSKPIAHLFTQDPVILESLSQFWWLVYLTQPINALVYVYDGLIFAAKGFSYLRNHLWIALLFAYLPCLLIAASKSSPTWVWLALAALNIYRLLSSACFFRKSPTA